MIDVSAVEHTGYKEVFRLEKFVFENVFVEGYADVIGSGKHSVGRGRHSENSRFLHIFNECNLLT